MVADAPISVVTGANSGIGRATAIHLAQRGHIVYGTVRATSRLDKLLTMAEQAGVEIQLVEVDVADDDSVRDGFARILDEAGRVDTLVNNAGIGGNAVAEEASPSLYLDVMNVNLCGAVRCLQAVLPQMRERGSGSIVNVTSVAGRVAAIGQSPYVASKFVGGFERGSGPGAGSLRHPRRHHRARRDEVGHLRQEHRRPERDGAYDAPYRRMFQFYATGLAHATDPIEVAEVIHHAITTDEPTLRYAMSWGGKKLIEGRALMDDHDWVALGALQDDSDYYHRFKELFELDISPPR